MKANISEEDYLLLQSNIRGTVQSIKELNSSMALVHVEIDEIIKANNFIRAI